ncbi:MAG TPA: molybdopterin-dependent oxidoreductase, partial [Dokdonella sp.]
EMPVAEVEKANVVVLVGCNPRHEMPLLGARIRKAARRGAKIYAINPLDFELDFDFAIAAKKIAAPGAFVDVLLGLAKAANDAGHPPESGDLAEAVRGVEADPFSKGLIEALAAAEAAVVVVGEGATLHPQASLLRAAARFLARATRSACNELPSGANALGLAAVGVLPGAGGLGARAMLEQPRRSYVLYGCEPPHDFADGAAALAALGAAEHVVAFAAYASDALKRVAGVILPIGLLPEIDATLVNVDGAAQTVAAAAKLPGDARPGWKVLRALGAALGADGFDFVDIGELRAQVGTPALPAPVADAKLAARAPAADGLVRIATTAIYAGDAVLRRAPALQAHPLARLRGVVLHPEDALARGLGHGGRARIGDAVLPVEVSARVPRGAAWIEAGHAETAALPAYGAALDVVKA